MGRERNRARVAAQQRVAIAAPLHADRGYGRTDAAADRDRGRDDTRRAHPNSTPGRMTDGHLSPKPIPTILSDATPTPWRWQRKGCQSARLGSSVECAKYKCICPVCAALACKI